MTITLKRFRNDVCVRLDLTPTPRATSRHRTRGRRVKWSCGPAGYAKAVELIARHLPMCKGVSIDVDSGITAWVAVGDETRVEAITSKTDALRRLIRVATWRADEEARVRSGEAGTISAELRALRPAELVDDLGGTLVDLVELWRRAAIQAYAEKHRRIHPQVGEAEGRAFASAAETIEAVGMALIPNFPRAHVGKPRVTKTGPYVCPGCGANPNVAHARGCELLRMTLEAAHPLAEAKRARAVVDELEHCKAELRRIAALSPTFVPEEGVDGYSLGRAALEAIAYLHEQKEPVYQITENPLTTSPDKRPSGALLASDKD